MAERPVPTLSPGHRPLRKLLTREQRDLFDAHAPLGTWFRSLSMISPIHVLKPKCAPLQAFDAAAETRAFLADHGVDLSAEPQTTTRTALDFFVNERQTAPKSK